MQIKKTKKTVTASKNIEKYIDADGMFGEKDAEISFDEIIDYWNNNCDEDPILTEYDNFDSWWMATKPHMTEISECSKINNCKTNYTKAQKHIKAAIDILAKCGKDDIIAKDNIANLSVVMFDLMGDKE